MDADDNFSDDLCPKCLDNPLCTNPKKKVLGMPFCSRHNTTIGSSSQELRVKKNLVNLALRQEAKRRQERRVEEELNSRLAAAQASTSETRTVRERTQAAFVDTANKWKRDLSAPEFSFSLSLDDVTPMSPAKKTKHTPPNKPPSYPPPPPPRHEADPPSAPVHPIPPEARAELAAQIRQEVELECAQECQNLMATHSEELKEMESQFDERVHSLQSHLQEAHKNQLEQNVGIDLIFRWVASSHPKLAQELVSLLTIETEQRPNFAVNQFITFISSLAK